MNGVSFVVPTIGTREFIATTLASIRREAAHLDSYEIIVCGYTERVPDAPDIVRWESPGRFPPGRVFFHGLGATLASKDRVAIVSDDMTLEPGWGAVAASIDLSLPVVFGQLIEADGFAHEEKTMTLHSVLGLIDRHLLHEYPIQIGTQNEDGLWCADLQRDHVICGFEPRLRWKHHGSPRSRGGFGSTYHG